MIIGFILDLIIGDPVNWPHIVRWYGRLIALLEGGLYRLKNKRLGGTILVVVVLAIVTAITLLVEYIAFRIHPFLFFIVDGILCWQCLAVKSLKDETLKVYKPLKDNDIEASRYAVSMVVGRDTESLDISGVTRACVETIAENTSDGIGAPLIYMGIGGGVLSCIYKAVNTMDSMIGYKNDRYISFGTCAARLDDVVNYIPARLTAFAMILAAYICGMEGSNAWRIFKRDRYRHASPNSAQTESVMAGALGVRLAGDASYFGKVHKKEYIGDALREIEVEDILKAHKLMQVTAYILFVAMLIWEAVWITIITVVR